MGKTERLYTSKEISELYGIPKKTIVTNWSKKGLKYIKGPKNSFLYRKEWVEEFIESQIIQKNNIKTADVKKSNLKNRKRNIQFVV